MSENATILIAYDGSEGAAHAIAEAGALFAGRKATVLSVWQSIEAAAAASLLAIPAGVAGEAYVELDRESAQRAQGTADKGAALAREAGLDATARQEMTRTSIWSAISAIAEDEEVAAVVIGSRGLSGLKSMFLGSVSSGVVNNCHRPVLVVHQPG